MALIEEYKILLEKLIAMKQMGSIDQLIKGISVLRSGFDAQMCNLMAQVCLMRDLKPAALVWAECGFQMDASVDGNRQIIEDLRGISVGDVHYEPFFSRNYTMLHKVLKIVIFNLDFHIFHYTAERFQETWEALGHRVFVFDCDHIEKSEKELLQFMQDGVPDMLFAFNNTYWSLYHSGKRYFSKNNKIPNVNFMFDHPFFFGEMLRAEYENPIATCVDRNHADFINRYYKNKIACFLPLGGQELPSYKRKPWRERKIEVLYVGAIKFAANGIYTHPFDTRLFEFMMGHTSYPTEKAIEKCFYDLSKEEYAEYFPELSVEKKQEEVTDEELLEIIHRFMKSDIIINTIYRVGAVAQLVNAGIPVTVYGNEEWTQMEYEHPENLHYMGKVSPLACIELMCDTKVVLNSLPWFKNGTHDRVVNAMLNGAVAVSDPSEYLLERYIDGTDILYYSLEHMDQLPEIVSSILQDPDRAEQIADNAYKKAMLTETWQNRAMQLLEDVIFAE